MIYHTESVSSRLAGDPTPPDLPTPPAGSPRMPQDRSRESWWRNRPTGPGMAPSGLTDADIHPWLEDR